MEKNKNFMIIGAVAVGILILAGAGFFLMNQSTVSDSENQIAASGEETFENNPAEEAMIEEETIATSGGGRYVEFENGTLEEYSDSNRVLFFYANWCPTCRPIDTELSENEAQIPEGMTVIKVNYNDPDTDDAEKELASTYNITNQHTFVQIDENGEEVTKWNGGGIEEIVENTK